MTTDQPSHSLTLRRLTARPVNVPLARPIRTALGSIPSSPLVLIDLMTEEGVPGRCYLFAYTALALAPLVQLVEALGAELVGQPAAPADCQRRLDRRLRLLGWQGLAGMAVSGIDMALWDALGRAAGWPVARLLGSAPRPLPAYDSFGIIDPVQDAPLLEASVEAGFRAIKIKLGGPPEVDLATVAAVRQIIGPTIQLMVDFNQSLDPVGARRQLARLAEHDLAWAEEPVPAEDLAGHAAVRSHSPVPIQTGENWWFPSDMAHAIAAGASDLAMLDLMKIGGFTGWRAAAGQAQAAALPVSSHIFLEASAHAMAATPTAHWLEHLDAAGAILAEPVRPVGGAVTARGPGLGLDWDETAVARFRV